MSELSHNNPERKKEQPLHDDCLSCDTKYNLDPSNSAGRYYPGQKECSYLYCVCPNCNQPTRVFCNDSTIDQAKREGLHIFDDEKYAEPEIYDAYCRAYGIELPKTYELTPRHEDIIRKFGETLINIPDDLLIDGFESEHLKPYPQRWIEQ